MEYGSVQSELPRLVKRGQTSPVFDELADAYPRALAFASCPKIRALAGNAKKIREIMLEVLLPQGLCEPENIPTQAVLTQIARGKEPVSMRSLSIGNHAFRLILKHRDLPGLERMANYIENEIGPDGFCDEAYVLSLHELRQARANTAYGEFREQIALKDGKLSGQRYYSSAVLRETQLRLYAPTLFTFLEEGYALKKDKQHHEHGGTGSYKVTELTARTVHSGIERLGEALGVSAPEFEEVFSFGATVGPRNGHSSRALSPHNGNLIR